MELEQAQKRIAEAISRKDLLMVVGECYVEYFGRAASKLPRGKRMLLIKGDNSFAIHQNRLLRPTNYMMGARIAVEMKNGALILNAKKQKPKETIKVIFYSIEGIHAYPLYENADLSLFGSERELSNELMQDLSFLEPGLKPLNQEEVFRKGIVDILAEDAEGRLVIIEVKRRQADYNAVMQLQRYVQQVCNIKGKKCRGLLVAPSIGKNAYELLERNNLEFFNFEFEIGNPKSTIKGVQKKQATIDRFF